MNKLLGIAVSGILLATATARAELVDNGGFVVGANPIGWTISGGTARLSAVNQNVYDSDGDGYLLELATGNDDENYLPRSVAYQVVDVTAGQTYELSFDHTAWATPGNIDLKVDVFDGSIDGTDVTSNPIGGGDLLTDSLDHAQTRVYQHYDATVAPTQNQLTIRFSDIGNATTVSQDLWVDNFQMEAVPEPTSVVLGALALLGWAVFFRRRRK